MNPNSKEFDTENFERLRSDKRKEQYIKDVQSGKASKFDFERYMYGGSAHKKAYTDERDLAEEKELAAARKIELETEKEIGLI